jgi:hypothetical protein
VTLNRWFNRGHYKVYKRVYGGMFNVWLGTVCLIEAIIKYTKEFKEVCLMCEFEQVV